MDIGSPRDIDRRIAELQGWRVEQVGKNFEKLPLFHVWNPDGKQIGHWGSSLADPRFTYNIGEGLETYDAFPEMFPHYSTDLNAALTLLGGDDLYWQIHGGGNITTVRIYQGKSIDGQFVDVSRHGSEPLAMLICLTYFDFLLRKSTLESEAS